MALVTRTGLGRKARVSTSRRGIAGLGLALAASLPPSVGAAAFAGRSVAEVLSASRSALRYPSRPPSPPPMGGSFRTTSAAEPNGGRRPSAPGMSTAAGADAPVVPGRPTWQQTMIRIADPAKSLPFYTDVLGMTLIDKLSFPEYKFTLYFVTTLPEGESYELTPGTREAHDYLWTYEGVALELTHNHGTEGGDFAGYHPGNQERDGFGHIAVSCDDVYACCEELEKAGISFKKKPDEGRMKGLAFAYDPDKYWVEIVRRSPGSVKNKYNFSQTMVRVKDPKKSIAFYKKLGMKLMYERHFGDFSLYYMASNAEAPEDPTAPEAAEAVKSLFNPILELTHNHGTEDDEDFKHYNGNEEGRQGFGHVGFLVDDVYEACDAIRELGYGFKKEPDGGVMKGLAFAYDPDGYAVEIIKRGGIDFGDDKVVLEKK